MREDSCLNFVLAKCRDHVADVEWDVPREIDKLVDQEGEPNKNGVVRVVVQHVAPRLFNYGRIDRPAREGQKRRFDKLKTGS